MICPICQTKNPQCKLMDKSRGQERDERWCAENLDSYDEIRGIGGRRVTWAKRPRLYIACHFLAGEDV